MGIYSKMQMTAIAPMPCRIARTWYQRINSEVPGRFCVWSTSWVRLALPDFHDGECHALMSSMLVKIPRLGTMMKVRDQESKLRNVGRGRP